MPAATGRARPTDRIKKMMTATLAIVDAGDSLRSVALEPTADEIGAVLVQTGGGTAESTRIVTRRGGLTTASASNYQRHA